jgi:uncharacterized protein with FMN-binding domain
MSQRKETPRRRWSRHDSVRLGVVAWFVVCWFIGASIGQADLDPFVELAWPEAARTLKLSDDVYQVEGSEGEVLGYVGLGAASGYGGPLEIAVAVDPDGRATSLSVVRHRETPAFFDRVVRSGMLRRLAGKTHQDRIVLGEDVDGVSGATYTALALAQSVHRVVRAVATDQLDLPVPADERRIVFGVPEIVLILLFVLGVTQRRMRVKKQLRNQLRWGTLLVGLVLLGFVYNSPFVLAHVNMVLIGYWPEWQTHLYWYLLVGGLLLFKAHRGRDQPRPDLPQSGPLELRSVRHDVQARGKQLPVRAPRDHGAGLDVLRAPLVQVSLPVAPAGGRGALRLVPKTRNHRMGQAASKTRNVSAILWLLLFVVCLGLAAAHLGTAVLKQADQETGLIEATFTKATAGS